MKTAWRLCSTTRTSVVDWRNIPLTLRIQNRHRTLRLPILNSVVSETNLLRTTSANVEDLCASGTHPGDRRSEGDRDNAAGSSGQGAPAVVSLGESHEAPFPATWCRLIAAFTGGREHVRLLERPTYNKSKLAVFQPPNPIMMG